MPPFPCGSAWAAVHSEGGLSLHAIPPKQVGRRGSWLDQTSFPDDWEVAPIKKKKRERERDTVASYYNFIMHFQHYCLFAIHSSFCLKCLFRSFFHFFYWVICLFPIDALESSTYFWYSFLTCLDTRSVCLTREAPWKKQANGIAEMAGDVIH